MTVTDLTLTYKTYTTTKVYKFLPGSTNLTAVGTLSGNKLLKFSSVTTGSGMPVGQIASSPAVSYVDPDGISSSATGTYISTSAVNVANTTNGGIDVSATKNDGTTTTISGITQATTNETVTVKTGALNYAIYSGPGREYKQQTSYTQGTSLKVYATAKASDGTIWAAYNAACTYWGPYRLANGTLVSTLNSTSTTGNSPTTSSSSLSSLTYNTGNLGASGDVTDASNDTYADQKAVKDVIANAAKSMSTTETEALTQLHKMQWVIGIPPKITPTADIQYMQRSNGVSPENNFGRCYTEMFMMDNTIFSVQPCKVNYLPGFSSDDKQTFWDAVSERLTGLGNDADLMNEDNIGLTGQLFEGAPDYNDYINTVNLLARTISIYLGIGDTKYMNTGTSYKNMDYSYYKIQSASGKSSKGIFGTIADTIRSTPSNIINAAISDDTYLHFYMTADGTSVNDSLTVQTKSSGLESLFNNNLSEIAQEIQFLAGTTSGFDFQSAIDSATSGLNSAATSLGTTLGNLVRYGGNYLRGGRLVFPQMLDDCTYDRSYSGTCRFISASGDKEAIFLNCYLPLCYLWPFVIPQMLSDNMYRYPFLCKCDAKGLFHCDLAAFTGLRIQRGGADGTCFTADGLPFEIDVSFDITPLYSKLMVTNTRHPVLYLSNTALQEYLGGMCGITFTGDQLKLKMNIITALYGNYQKDTIPSMLRGYYSSGIANWLRGIFNV